MSPDLASVKPSDQGALGSKQVGDLIDGEATISADGYVYASLKKVKNFTEFDKSEKEGYYFPVSLGERYSGKNKCRRTSGTPNDWKTNSEDAEWVLKLTNGKDTVFEFATTDNDTPFLTLKFANVTLLE